MNRKLITVRADDNIKGYTEKTIPLIEECAKKWGADFMRLTDGSPSDYSDGKFHYRIMKIGELLDQYDRVLNLDADMIILPSCPNPFDIIDPDKIATIFEDVGSRIEHRQDLIRTVQNHWGDVNWKSGYINTGFFMVSKKHKDIFELHNGTVWNGFGFDDVHLGYKIREKGHQIQEMEYKFNHMTMFSEDWHPANRFESYIIHYAGKGVFDERRIAHKNIQIAEDLSTAYSGKDPITID